MTTQTYTSPIDHTSNAGFQAWSSALDAAIIAAGLVNTADTGQANLASAARPAINTFVYKTYRFNDTQQGAAPIFIRLNYGTGGALTSPRMTMTVGTGSDGAGNITGTISIANLNITNINTAATSTAASFTTRACAVDGAFWFAWGLGAGASTQALGFAAIVRSVNNLGVASADSALVYSKVGAGGAVTTTGLNFAAATILSYTAGSHSFIVGGTTTSLVGGAAQVYKHYIAQPRVRPHPWILTVMSAEIGNNTQFQATAVGVTQRNYISLGSDFNSASSNLALPSSASQTYGCIWE